MNADESYWTGKGTTPCKSRVMRLSSLCLGLLVIYYTDASDSSITIQKETQSHSVADQQTLRPRSRSELYSPLLFNTNHRNPHFSPITTNPRVSTPPPPAPFQDLVVPEQYAGSILPFSPIQTVEVKTSPSLTLPKEALSVRSVPETMRDYNHSFLASSSKTYGDGVDEEESFGGISSIPFDSDTDKMDSFSEQTELPTPRLEFSEVDGYDSMTSEDSAASPSSFSTNEEENERNMNRKAKLDSTRRFGFPLPSRVASGNHTVTPYSDDHPAEQKRTHSI